MGARRGWYVVAAAVTTGWGTIPLVLRQVHLPPVAIAFGRTSLAAVALGAVLLLERRRPSPARRAPLLSVRPARCVVTAATLGLHWLALFAAYDRAPAATVILIVYLAPVLVAAAAPAVVGEQVGARTAGALAVGLVGIALVVSPTIGGIGARGLGLSLLAMVTFAALFLLGKPLSDAYGGLRLAFIEMTGASLALLPFALAARWGPPRAAWWWLVALGVVHTAAGIALYLAALARLPATHVAILGYFEPVAVVGFAWAVLGQRVPVATMLGGVLVVGAGALLVRGDDAEVVAVAG